MNPAALSGEIKALALELGFVRVGFAEASALPEDAARLQAWLAAEHHGQMAYMAETAGVRSDPRHPDMMPSARSVIVLATAYSRAAALPPLPGGGRIARYAQGRDYHPVLYDRLRAIKRKLRDAGATARACVDSMPILERAWAVRAGLGFIGKNACLIVPGVGSHVLLSAVLTSAELVSDTPMRERCGNCRLCLDACPTRAFKAPRTLDARRCIAYLTIEHEGAIDSELREGVGDWIFGCDVCQDVCPYNRTEQPQPIAADPHAPRDRLRELGTEDFLRMDEAVFDRYTRGTALRRAGREGMARNAALALGNGRDKRHLPLLEQVASRDPSEVVREAASWARDRLTRSDD
ncbi:MAG TPA: tRNA epoxyqueuosine(34) reductase QueG [Polyangiales bacterium]|nr:tRNA epoxyqueuosine(34) reductase QueG [Polyangiales bacterium]